MTSLAAILACSMLSRSEVAEPTRVATALKHYQSTNRGICRKLGIPYPPKNLFIKAYKREKLMELWGAGAAASPMNLLASFRIQTLAGTMGPKRHEGDNQVPEGFYHLAQFNPYSKFKLSLKVSYPNPMDKAISPKSPGGDIFIHGGNLTIGCIPIGDEGIEQLYAFCWASAQAWHSKIPIHIFPTRLTDDAWRSLSSQYAGRRDLLNVWEPLRKAEQIFIRSRRAPKITFEKGGRPQVS